jgi:aminoglycoside phosphotransferase family enzyme/predicted kinase
MSKKLSWMKTMLDPASYPHPVDDVLMVQTHISWVFLAGDRVYKLKKPVDFGFLNFTTLEKRRHFCLEELRLNRRLCPEIYLDVWPVTFDDGQIKINGTGEPVEWAVVMRRMPEEGMMVRLLSENMVGNAEIDTVVNRLAPFYKNAAAGEKIKNFGTIDIIRQNTEENFDQTASFVGKLIEKAAYSHICNYTRSFIDSNKPLFLSRIEQDLIREGHGDLYSANICFDKTNNAVYIFDCIEFNERFRCGDVASDVAFLAMDLDYHGLPTLSNYFVRSFSDQIGDAQLLELMDFYKCYRAYVRGKIGCFTWASDGIDSDTKEKAGRQASKYFRLALNYAGGIGVPDLYVFFGLSGTGKTVIASAWAKNHQLPFYNSDRVRKGSVARIPTEERHWEPFGEGIYSQQQTLKTYKALACLAGKHLMQGEPVILDATYRDREERLRLLGLAREAKANIHFILCTCPEQEIKERLTQRARIETQVSDGRWEIYLKQKEVFAPTDDLDQDHLMVLPTNRPIAELLDELDNKFPNQRRSIILGR